MPLHPAIDSLPDVWERLGQLAKVIVGSALTGFDELKLEHEMPVADAQSDDACSVRPQRETRLVARTKKKLPMAADELYEQWVKRGGDAGGHRQKDTSLRDSVSEGDLGGPFARGTAGVTAVRSCAVVLYVERRGYLCARRLRGGLPGLGGGRGAVGVRGHRGAERGAVPG